MGTQQGTRRPDRTVRVAIVGGGPVGLALAYLLGRQGVATALFEQRNEATYLLKGQYLGPTTVELFRQWGILEEAGAGGWAYDRYNGAGIYETLKSGLILDAPVSSGSEQAFTDLWSTLVPAAPRGVPASAYEAALVRIAQAWPHVALNHGSIVLDVDNRPDGALLTVKDKASGEVYSVQADYAVVAAGKNNPLSKRLGIHTRRGPDFGARILALFHAPLRELVGDRPYYFFRVLNPDYRGLFQSEIPASGLWSYLYAGTSAGDIARDKVLRRVRGAIGDPDFPVDLRDVIRFDYNTGIAERWRAGRVFLAGDAAHHHVPSGGFGVNMGLKDANNLAWKLALVVNGLADDALLDTYEAEQRPVVERLIKLATYTSTNLVALFDAVDALEDFTAEGARPLSEAAIDALKNLYYRNNLFFVHTGQLLGATYRSRAIIGADPALPVIPFDGHYTETVQPGARAPHLWLTRDGAKLSLIDLLGESFALVSPASGAWDGADLKVDGTTGPRVRPIIIGPGAVFATEDPKWADTYRLAPHEAILIRPDGFIAARLSADDPASAGRVLGNALGLIARGAD